MNEQNTSKSFWMGVGAAVIVGFVIGFFVLLFMVLSEDSSGSSSKNSNDAAAGSGDTAQVQDIILAEVSDDDWIRGDKNADLTIVEFSDLECPFCKQFHSTMQQVMSQYDGQVRLVYRHFPLVSLHPKAPKEAEATECAGELAGNDGFWKFTDKLFEITPSNNGLDLEQLPQIAEDIGLDKAKFTVCLNSGKYASKVRAQASDATAAGGQGTPYSVLITQDGQKIPINGAQPFSSVAQLIDSLL